MFRHVTARFRSDSFIKRTLCLAFLIAFLLPPEISITWNAQATSSHFSFTPSRRQQAPQNTGAQKAQEADVLEQGKPVERELAAGQNHAYQITLAVGQFLNVIVEQRGIDVVVRLLGPDGKQISELDPEIGKQGQITISYVAEVAGAYRLNVQVVSQKDASAGHYEIQLVELRAATEKDRALQEARKLGAEFIRLYRAGKYDEALSFAERALDIREKMLGLEHYSVAVSLNRLAVLYSTKSDYAKAETLYQRALDILEKVLGPEHPRIADVLNNLAGIYYTKGDYEKAGLFYERALTIREKALGPEHLDVAQALNNLANVYKEKGDYEKAEPLYQRALASREKTLGLQNPEIVPSLNNLAENYSAKGEYEKAEPLYQRALGILEKTFEPYHPNIAYPLDGLADLYYSRGEYEKSTTLHQRALEIREKAIGPHHPEVAASLTKLAILYAAKGDLPQSVTFQSRASVINERNLSLNLVTGSERQKLAYLATLSARASQTISLHVRYATSDPAARSLAATTTLQRKGRVLDAMADSVATLRRRFNAQDQALLDQLKDTTARLARLVLGGPQRVDPTEHQKQVKSLEEQKEKLEHEISRHSAEFRTQSQPITLAAIQAAIPADAALIEFASYQPFNARASGNDKAYDEPHYVAYILRREGDILWKELGDAKSIDDAIDAFRRALRDPKRRDVKTLARAVDEKVMRPVRALLGGATQLLVSPDGALNLIPFESLVDEQGRYLIERHSFAYLTSGRDLLRLQVERESKSDPLLVADPMFGVLEAGQLAKADISRRRSPTRTRLGQSVTTGADLSGVYFAPLVGAALEAREIKSLFPEAQALTGEQATEASLKQAAAPRILHIATHGFFLDDQPVKMEGTRGLMQGDGDLGRLAANLKIENPLLRSGLALAGANLRKSGGDDGILTALEASGLNLWGTKLVVLSACDTGIGVVKTGEGVYGLRRALVLAGSETQVMSLWPVSDYITRRLMKAYYAGLKQGQGRGEALRRVKLEMRRRQGLEHPFYWASFIQSGEWAALEAKRQSK